MDTQYIYNLIEEEHLESMLETFYETIDLPIQVIDSNGKIIKKHGITSSFCSIFEKGLSILDSCENMHISASKKAVTLGEAYIFSCQSNLNHIVFPLINNSYFFGSVIVGPFLMTVPDSLFIQDISKKYTFKTDTLFELYEEVTKIKVVEPKKVTYISQLLNFLFINLISDSRQELAINNEKLHQQSKINEAIQLFKSSEITKTSNYPIETEKKLIKAIREGNSKEAINVLNGLLGYILYIEGLGINSLKNRTVELCSVLSRVAIDSGANTNIILKENDELFCLLQNSDDVDLLCLNVKKVVETYIDSIFCYAPSKNFKNMNKAIIYIKRNFTKNITLEEVAQVVNLNPTYFSTLFKQTFNSTFKESLNKLRIEESKKLLSNTDFLIIDIAIATGFSDQSYFSKTFKKYTGLSPKQYRNQFTI